MRNVKMFRVCDIWKSWLIEFRRTLKNSLTKYSNKWNFIERSKNVTSTKTVELSLCEAEKLGMSSTKKQKKKYFSISGTFFHQIFVFCVFGSWLVFCRCHCSVQNFISSTKPPLNLLLSLFPHNIKEFQNKETIEENLFGFEVCLYFCVTCVLFWFHWSFEMKCNNELFDLFSN
jgi:hypothetical protein